MQNSTLQKDIIETLGLQNVSDEAKKQIIERSLEAVELRVFDRILKQLDDEAKKDFVIHLEQENEAGIAHILAENGVDAVRIMMEQLKEFKKKI